MAASCGISRGGSNFCTVQFYNANARLYDCMMAAAGVNCVGDATGKLDIVREVAYISADGVRWTAEG